MNLELMSILTDTSRLWALPEICFLQYAKIAQHSEAGAIDARAPGSSYRSDGNVAIINVSGPIDYKPTIFTAIFGGAAITSMRSMFRQALDDDSIKAVLFSFNSPGGSVTGMHELSTEIYQARGRKPIIAQVDPMACSAAYCLAASADRIVSMESGESGNIGVITGHADLSGKLEKDGVKVTVISAGKYKADGSPFAALSEEAYGRIKARVDAAYDIFVGDVARGRGVTPSAVKNGFGEGLSLSGPLAKEAGLVDSLAMADDTIGRLLGGKSVAGLRAEDATGELVAADAAVAVSDEFVRRLRLL